MKAIPRITDTEWEVMRVIWAKHPVTAAEIIEALVAQDASWHPKTARTLLTRLVRKGALDYEAKGRLYVYEPRVTERQCVREASTSFLERVFGGSLKPLLAHFVEEKKLTREEFEELEQLFERTRSESVRRGKNHGNE